MSSTAAKLRAMYEKTAPEEEDILDAEGADDVTKAKARGASAL